MYPSLALSLSHPSLFISSLSFEGKWGYQKVSAWLGKEEKVNERYTKCFLWSQFQIDDTDHSQPGKSANAKTNLTYFIGHLMTFQKICIYRAQIRKAENLQFGV